VPVVSQVFSLSDKRKERDCAAVTYWCLSVTGERELAAIHKAGCGHQFGAKAYGSLEACKSAARLLGITNYQVIPQHRTFW
jgi:hypothetical protein